MRVFPKLAVALALGIPVSNAIADQIGDVFVIAMENHNWTQPVAQLSPQPIFGNPAAPYINSLVTPGNANAAQVSYASGNIYNVPHLTRLMDQNGITVAVNHSSDTKTMREIFGLSPLLSNPIPATALNDTGTGYNTVSSVNDLSDMFVPGTVPAPRPASFWDGVALLGGLAAARILRRVQRG